MGEWGIVLDELHNFEALPNRYQVGRVGCFYKS